MCHVQHTFILIIALTEALLRQGSAINLLKRITGSTFSFKDRI